MNICRTCLNNISSDLASIFSKLDDRFIANIITDCSAVSILEDDGLPSIICQECIESVQTIVIFAAKVRESDRKLRQLFKSEILLCDIEEGKEGYDHGPDAFNSSYELLKVEVEKVEVQSESAESQLDFEDGNESDWNVEGLMQSEDEEGVGWEVGVKDQVKQAADEECPKGQRAKRKPKKAEDDAKENSRPLDEKERELYEPIRIDPARYVCCWCCVDFETKEELLQHSVNHQNGLWKREKVYRPHYCEICFRCFKRPQSLEKHMKEAATLSSQTMYQCKRCSARFVAPRRMRLHLVHHKIEDARGGQMEINERKEKTRICCKLLCSKQFDTEEDLLEHGQTEHIASKQESSDPNQPYECPVCFKHFKRASSLYKHRNRLYKSGTQCSICGKKFKSEKAMTTHEWMHKNERPYGCEICAKMFPTTESLKHHMLVHTDEKPFVCSVCGWSFKRESNLKIHMLIHSELLPFKCEVCDMSFKGKHHLRDHMRQHTGAKPWKCQYCDKTFAHHANRTRHEISHTGIKPHKCSYCDKSFIRKRQLVEHESTHTGIEPYRCEACNRLFGSKSEFEKHLDVHPKALLPVQKTEDPTIPALF